ncbi:Ppx/GppA phosphatase family protein [soil metagenome]
MKNVLAAIDIGTNSFHLVIAKYDRSKPFTILTKEKEVIRLGSSLNDMKYLKQDAIDRGIEALKRFKLICDTYSAPIRAVATSATREALNKDEFIQRAYIETGIKIEVISGYEEARLIYLGVLQALDIFNKKILLIDIGGGSTEFLIGKQGSIEYANSLKLGAVRLTQRFFSDDDEGKNESKNYKLKDANIDEARLFVKGALTQAVRELSERSYDMVIGTSGTISNIASIIMSSKEDSEFDELQVNNFKFNRSDLEATIKKILKAKTASERQKLPGLDPKRADIIVAGGIILEQIFEEIGLKQITVSNFALREGLLLDTLANMDDTQLPIRLNDVRYKSVLHLAESVNYESKHAQHVKFLSSKIYNFMKGHTQLEGQDEEYLQAASLLHDIGYYISHSNHHKHSYYLIRNSQKLLGFNDREIEIIANIARYHRKSHPKLKHEGYAKLNAEDRETVKRLSGILRLGDALDRSHDAAVKDIEFEKKGNEIFLKLKLEENFDPSLEIWGVGIRKTLFEECFGVKVSVI